MINRYLDIFAFCSSQYASREGSNVLKSKHRILVRCAIYWQDTECDLFLPSFVLAISNLILQQKDSKILIRDHIVLNILMWSPSNSVTVTIPEPIPFSLHHARGMAEKSVSKEISLTFSDNINTFSLPPRAPVTNWRFSSGFPSQNGIILVLTGIPGGGGSSNQWATFFGGHFLVPFPRERYKQSWQITSSNEQWQSTPGYIPWNINRI